MIKTISTLILILSFSILLQAQFQQAQMLKDGTIRIQKILPPPHLSLQNRNNTFNQLEGFPKGHPASPNFKNVRNVSLADVNGDGLEDVLFAADNQLLAHGYDGLIWQKTLHQTATFPPSVADIDDDGELEIVQVVFGGAGIGGVYVMEKNGEDLTGWPILFAQKGVASAALSDLDGDNIMEIIVNEIGGGGVQDVHVFKLDATYFNDNWPVRLAARPAVTPSVADIDNDGEKEIILCTTEARYVLNLQGEAEAGWPIVTDPTVRFSWHSPVLVDFDEDNTWEIVGSSTGDAPEFWILNHDGTSRMGWPQAVPENTWTFSPPTVVQIAGEFRIFMSRPIFQDPDNPLSKDMLYGWDKDGNMLEGFPIFQEDGLEGFISVADVDNDDEFELVYGSNTLGADGLGFIHAYEMDASQEVEGFPIRPQGWTFFNGTNLGDINGDGMMDLSALTYMQHFGADVDSVFLNVYDLAVPYAPEKILWSTYKGNNLRDGVPFPSIVSSLKSINPSTNIDLQLFPNPIENQLKIQIRVIEKEQLSIHVLNLLGQKLMEVANNEVVIKEQQWEVNLTDLQAGVFIIEIQNQDGFLNSYKMMKQ